MRWFAAILLISGCSTGEIPGTGEGQDVLFQNPVCLLLCNGQLSGARTNAGDNSSASNSQSQTQGIGN